MKGQVSFSLFLLFCILPMVILAHRHRYHGWGGRGHFSGVGMSGGWNNLYPSYYDSWQLGTGFGNQFDMYNGLGSPFTSWNNVGTAGQWPGSWGNSWNSNIPFNNGGVVQIPGAIDPLTGLNTQIPFNSGVQGTGINRLNLNGFNTFSPTAWSNPGLLNSGGIGVPGAGFGAVQPTLGGIGLPGVGNDPFLFNSGKK